jgi:ankyrin repeat protein
VCPSDRSSPTANTRWHASTALDTKSAAQLGRLDDLRALVAANPQSVHLRGGDGQTPLHVAPTVAIAEFLLSHGADIDARDVDHESTPAQYHPDVALFLVERGRALIS